MLAGALISSLYCCRLSVGVLVGAVALDISGLTVLVARGRMFRISARVTNLAHLASSCARVAVGGTYG